MKAKTNTLLIFVALLAYWVGLCNASAFYDPGAQRWLNRDPIQEDGGINLYAYAGNRPVNEIDFLGLTSAPSQPSPPDNPNTSPSACPTGNPPPDPCPGFKSQWDPLTGSGGKIAGGIGKGITCLDGKRHCHFNCDLEYGSSSWDNDKPACLEKCKADCEANLAKCLGLKSPGSGQPKK